MFADIPELVVLLSRYLTTQDLFTCVRVSSQWYHLFVPFLWHTVDDSTPSWNHILYQCSDPGVQRWESYLGQTLTDVDKNKDREWLMHVFHKYGHHIRNLTIHWPMVLEAASKASGCLTLQSLTLEMRTPTLPHSIIPGGGYFGPTMNSPPPSLFPGVAEESDYNQPHFCGWMPEIQKEIKEFGWALTQHYWNLIFRNQDLTRLVLHHPSGFEWRVKSTGVFLRGMATLKHLKELQGWEFIALPSIWELLAAVPTLESLEAPIDLLPDPLPEVNTTLRTLTVHNALSINSLLDVLGLFPNLSSLTVPMIMVRDAQQPQPQSPGFGKVTSSVSANVLPRVPSIGANLRELIVTNVDDYATLLKLLPDHVELTWFERTQNCMVVPLKLPEHSTRFGVFKAPGRPWYIDEVLEDRPLHDVANELFVTSSRLRVFDSIRHFVHVDEMLRQPWACMGLEWLTCRIVGLDRLKDTEQALVDRVLAPGYTSDLSAEEGAAVEKFQRSRAQHHGIYDRLASLSKLKHLELGFENRCQLTYRDGPTYVGTDGKEYVKYAEPMFDTLELSLASGLDRLGALKGMEMIGFECINHRIGRAELKWMAKSWPKLRLMYGLSKEKQHRLEHNEERTALREYFQQLRPDVVHDSLYNATIGQ
ncbi:hypothetical protein BGZ74_004515 [Mortierella antarctica]|nr:hypothetical protein BGZ74_004515 [Mortierella antarctica]